MKIYLSWIPPLLRPEGRKKNFLETAPHLSKGLESGILPIFAVQSGILAFGIQNTAQGIRNQSKDWYPESKFH